jgi:hypothetical protein
VWSRIWEQTHRVLLLRGAPFLGASAAFVLLTSSLAHAGDAPAAPASSARSAPAAYGGEPATQTGPIRSAPPEYVAEPAPTPPPLGHHGFQLAIRSGVALPFGSANGSSFGLSNPPPEHWSSSMSDLSGWQIPLTIDIGGKPNPHVFIGGYISYAMGQTAGRLADACDRLPLDCYSSSFRIGAQIHYVFSPHEWVTPWLGYGIGYSWFSAGDGVRDVSLRGFEFAHFLGGVDIRLSRTLGIGPFVDWSIGSYGHQDLAASPPQTGAVSGDIPNRAANYWLTIGPRIVFLP